MRTIEKNCASAVPSSWTSTQTGSSSGSRKSSDVLPAKTPSGIIVIDTYTRGGDAEFLRRVPGTKGQPHTTLHGGHFLQEDDPQRFAELILGRAFSEKWEPVFG